MANSTLNKKLDLSWGNPYFLLEILQNIYTPKTGGILPIGDLTYADDIGEERLLKYIENITKITTGQTYKHYIITNGATQAINTVMRVWSKERNLKNVVTSKLGYPYYSGMIRKHEKLSHKKTNLNTYDSDSNKDIILIDSPSNPLGEQLNRTYEGNVLWDNVYHNTIYNACPAIQPKHNVSVGSFSKLLGLTGARVGWIATNNHFDFQEFAVDALYENATVSKISQHLIINILDSIDLNQFMGLGKNSLDQNRMGLQKLAHITGVDVQEKGMFYCFEADGKLFDLFDRANITYVRLNDGNNDLIRLNIGQTNDILKKAVKAVLKADRIK